MKKLLLLLLTVAWLAQGMDNNEGGLRHRNVSTEQQNSPSNQKLSMQDIYIAKNREMEKEWAKKTNMAHLRECLKDSQLMLCIGITNVVTAAALYALYNYLQQTN